MKWEHKVNLQWLKDRQEWLTATDIKDLIPYTKTGRERRITLEDYYKVWIRKQIELTEEDTKSTGAAARGHLLEPYAIQAFSQGKKLNKEFYHWDDCLIFNHDNGLSYSPDGLTVRQLAGVTSIDVLALPHEPRNLVEVKSYSPEAHLNRILTHQELLEERWQIATAFAVDEQLEYATLILFNPSLKISTIRLATHTYDREDLEDEIETILGIAQNWKKVLDDPFITEATADFTAITESQIIADLEKKQKLNP